MAVVSISRIQQRRGRALNGTGLPQLSSGELGWAIDTQELFIGNGAVSEGAPYVGNTRILTQSDLDLFTQSNNIFSLLSYVYKASGSISSFTIIGGSGYTSGTYQNIELAWLAGGSQPLTMPTMNLTIANGVVTNASLVFAGSGIAVNSSFTVTNPVIGSGSGFKVYVSGTSNSSGQVISRAVKRSVQSRLDDQVTTRDFGVTGNGLIDDTIALQTAIDELYLNKVTAFADNGVDNRIVLSIPAGIYNISDTIYIPSYATLVGEGVDKTIIKFNSSIVTPATINAGTTTLYTPLASLKMIGATVVDSNLPPETIVASVTPGVSVTLNKSASGNIFGSNVTIKLIIDKPVILFTNGDSTAGSYQEPLTNTYLNQPKYITIKDLTIQTTYGLHTVVDATSIRNSSFENVKITGNWEELYNVDSIGIKLSANSDLVTCKDNIFKNISIYDFSYGIYSDHDILNNKFINGYIENTRYGVCLGVNTNGLSVEQLTGPCYTLVDNYKFYNIKREAVFVSADSAFNEFNNLTVDNVGNDGGSTDSPIYPQLYFSSYKNKVSNIISDRHNRLGKATLASVYIPEATGAIEYQSFGYTKLQLTQNTTSELKIRLPLSYNAYGEPTGNISYKVNYIYKSSTNSFIQSGTLYITIDVANKLLQFSEEYDYSGNDDFNMSIDFSAFLLTSTNIKITNSSVPFNLGIFYRNTLEADAGVLTYSYTAVSNT